MEHPYADDGAIGTCATAIIVKVARKSVTVTYEVPPIVHKDLDLFKLQIPKSKAATPLSVNRNEPCMMLLSYKQLSGFLCTYYRYRYSYAV